MLDKATGRLLVGRGSTHKKISDYCQTLYPNTRGYSEGSIPRFCRACNIRRISDVENDSYVENFISLYGHGYDRSVMQSSIRCTLGISSGIVSQRRIARSLKRLAPLAYEVRARDTLDRTNRISYFPPYFGYKAHMDQNEKIAQGFGCMHVALIDGCSRMIFGYASIEVKNPKLIYEYVFRPAILKYGLWNQLSIDHGQEFSLCIFAQDLLKNYRQNTEKEPRKQTASKQNNVIERFWPELNSRVNYSVKRALISIVEENDYNMSDPVLKHCVSWITNYICQDAT